MVEGWTSEIGDRIAEGDWAVVRSFSIVFIFRAMLPGPVGHPLSKVKVRRRPAKKQKVESRAGASVRRLAGGGVGRRFNNSDERLRRRAEAES